MFAKTWIRKLFLRKVMSKVWNLQPATENLQPTEKRSLKRLCVMKIFVLLIDWMDLRSQSLKTSLNDS